MLKSKKLFISGACMLAMAGMVAPTAINAQEKDMSGKTGTTNVSYDNRNVIPDNNNEYGMIIPTAINFSDSEGGNTANADIEITGINGYKLEDWTTLAVKVTIKSEKGYKLEGTESTPTAGKSAKYKLAMNDETELTESQSTNPYEMTQLFGIGTADVDSDQEDEVMVSKVTGTATLTDKSGATVKGQYKDTLTYTFEQLANVKK